MRTLMAGTILFPFSLLSKLEGFVANMVKKFSNFALSVVAFLMTVTLGSFAFLGNVEKSFAVDSSTDQIVTGAICAPGRNVNDKITSAELSHKKTDYLAGGADTTNVTTWKQNAYELVTFQSLLTFANTDYSLVRGDYFTVDLDPDTLPAGIVTRESSVFPEAGFTDANGEWVPVAVPVYDIANNQVRYIFNEYVEQRSNITISLKQAVYADQDRILNEGSHTFTITVGNQAPYQFTYDLIYNNVDFSPVPAAGTVIADGMLYSFDALTGDWKYRAKIEVGAGDTVAFAVTAGGTPSPISYKIYGGPAGSLAGSFAVPAGMTDVTADFTVSYDTATAKTVSGPRNFDEYVIEVSGNYTLGTAQGYEQLNAFAGAIVNPTAEQLSKTSGYAGQVAAIYQLQLDAYAQAAAQANGPLPCAPSLTVRKVSSENTQLTLADAEFKLQRTGSESVAGDVTAEIVGETNADGELVFPALKAGTYTLVETAAPAGYQLNTAVLSFEVALDGVITYDGVTAAQAAGISFNEAEVTVENTPEPKPETPVDPTPETPVNPSQELPVDPTTETPGGNGNSGTSTPPTISAELPAAPTPVLDQPGLAYTGSSAAALVTLVLFLTVVGAASVAVRRKVEL